MSEVKLPCGTKVTSVILSCGDHSILRPSTTNVRLVVEDPEGAVLPFTLQVEKDDLMDVVIPRSTCSARKFTLTLNIDSLKEMYRFLYEVICDATDRPRRGVR